MMRIDKNTAVLAAFFTLLLIEVGLQTFWLGEGSIYVRPILYLVLAVLYLLVGVYMSKKGVRLRVPSLGQRRKWGQMGVFALLLMLLYGCWVDMNTLVEQNEVSPLNSDVIPCVDAYVQRFVSGEKVYRDIHFASWDVAPTYVTLMWMPYVLADRLGVDYRMFSFYLFASFLLIAYFLSLWKYPDRMGWGISLLAAPVLLWLLLLSDPLIFVHSLELTIAVFYMLLAFTVLHEKRWVIALGVLLCLLSRYSLSFWLVSYMLVIGYTRGWRDFVYVNLYILLGVLLLFFPFIADDPGVFVDGVKYYTKAAEGEWGLQNWQAPGSDPHQLSRGFGFAIYFYKLAGGAVVDRLKVLQHSHLILSIGAAVLVLLLSYINRYNTTNLRLFLLFGLKFFLMIFFVFLQVPYSYLFIVPLFLNIPILYRIAV